MSNPTQNPKAKAMPTDRMPCEAPGCSESATHFSQLSLDGHYLIGAPFSGCFRHVMDITVKPISITEAENKLYGRLPYGPAKSVSSQH